LVIDCFQDHFMTYLGISVSVPCAFLTGECL
jgi:hypothetical protein